MTARTFALAVAACLAPVFARAEIADVKVTTDTSIDCSSIQTIARDLYRDCKTDEDKAVATWYFVRRVMFHWPHIPTWDTLDLINSYGIGLCGYQSKAYAEIIQAGGYKARTLQMPGHVLAEVFYDNDWHFFDCQVGWFAYEEKDGKRTVASHEDIARDPDIVLKALDEGRASKPFYQCRSGPQSSDKIEAGVNYAQNAKPNGAPKVPTNRLVINLRPGESITRNWSNEGKSWFDIEKSKDGNFRSLQHSCTAGAVDENDPVNWPYWKPYAVLTTNKEDKPRYAPKRLYGNGRMIYEPDLSTEAFREGLAEDGLKGIKTHDDKTAPNLHPAEAGVAGSVIFQIDCPYVMVDAWLDLAGMRKGASDIVAVRAKGKGDWVEVFRAKQNGSFEARQISLKDVAWEQKQYLVKIEMKASADTRDAGLDKIRFTTVFLNNMYALPYFMPGKNTIKVTAAEGTDLKRNKLTLKYVWEEDGKQRQLERAIDKLPFETTVTVAGQEIPRMKSVTLAVAP